MEDWRNQGIEWVGWWVWVVIVVVVVVANGGKSVQSSMMRDGNGSGVG